MSSFEVFHLNFFDTGSVTKPGGHGFSSAGWLVSSRNLPVSALSALPTQVLQRHAVPFYRGPRDPNSVGLSPIEPFLQEVAKPFAKKESIRAFKSPLTHVGQRVPDRETEIQMVWVSENLTSKQLEADFCKPVYFHAVSLFLSLRVVFCFESMVFTVMREV